MLSTVAGGVLLFSQDALVYATGIRESIPAFAHGYRWVGPLLIAAYSLVVVGLFVYVLSVARRLRHVQRELSRLEADLKRNERL